MIYLSALSLIIAATLIIITTAFLRLLYLFSPNARRPPVKSKDEPSHMVVVLGSGGHTAEMVSLLRDTDAARYKHRTYIISAGDNFSSTKAQDCEERIQSKLRPSSPCTKSGEFDATTGIWDLIVVPRAREIHQPLYTAPISSFWCMLGCLKALHKISMTSTIHQQYPDIIITNGPATAVLVVMASFLLKFLGVAPLWKMQTIYVESWARVKTLSLSGKVLLWLGIYDRFLVQWEGLAKQINGDNAQKRVEWRGFLVH
ncbi:Bcalg14 [Botrytis cinerea B05.10]|uniref:UDP-N-acetylglucosamine transferase subunit ALG14 n=2 Tax=Botryotinia fuckeliana TaxID=40559 RepID=A0A384JEW9_BOTFB|nr:Bcalg14 [Botrytis cinerea B05.10]ATZ49010.1 Bcalg14 [Botrytis cinerea B05.10]EMR86523.1 putative glycosyltransferase family protein [Botrytis cinerea BcDW1]